MLSLNGWRGVCVACAWRVRGVCVEEGGGLEGWCARRQRLNPVRVKVGLRVGVSFDPLVISKSVCTQEKVMGAPRSFVALGVVMVGLLGLTVDPVDGSREDAVQVEGVRGTGGVMRRSLPIGDFNIDDITTADEVTPEELEKHLADKNAAHGGNSKAVDDLNVYLSSVGKTYSDEFPGVAVIVKGEVMDKYAAESAIKNGTRYVMQKEENRQEIILRSKDKLTLENAGTFSIACVEPSICRAFSSRVRSRPTEVTPGVWEMRTYLTYMCRKEGKSPISFSISRRATANGKGRMGFALAWEKECGAGPVYGFNVRLREKYGKTNGEVITDGATAPEFLPYLTGIGSSGFKVGILERTTWFVVNGPPAGSTDTFSLNFNISSVKVSKPKGRVRSDGPRHSNPASNVLAVMLDGDASNGGTLNAGDSVPLILRYDCLESGVASIEVAFSLQAGVGGSGHTDRRTAVFGFQKSCHVGPLPGFDIAMSGVDLGTSFMVVKDGLPVQSFSKTDHSARVSPKKSALSLELLMVRPMVAIDFGRPRIHVRVSSLSPSVVKPKDGLPNPILPSRPGSFVDAISDVIGPRSVFGGAGSIFDRLAPMFSRLGGRGGGAAPPPPPPLPGLDNSFSDDDEDPFGPFMGGGVRRRLWRPKISHLTESTDPKSRVVEVSMTGDAAFGGTIQSNSSSMLTIIHDCLRTGSAVVEVTIPLKRPRASMSIKKAGTDDTKAFLKRVMEKLKQLRSESTIVFAYTKECQQGPIPGFDISLGQVMTTGVKDFFPVKSGIVTPAYRASRAEMRVREGEEVSRVYFSLNMPGTKVQISEPVVRTHPKIGTQAGSDIFDPKVRVMGAVGSHTEDQFARNGKPFDVVGPRSFIRTARGKRWAHPKIVEIQYNCKMSGLAKMFLSFHVTQFRIDPKTKEYKASNRGPRQLTVGWVKECHVPAIKGLTVKCLDRPDKTGKAERGDFVVVNGAPTANYEPSVHSWIYGPRDKTAYFYISSSVNSTMRFDPPVVSSSNDGVRLSMDGVNSGKGNAPFFLSSQKKPQELKLHFECVSYGSSIVTVTIPFRPDPNGDDNGPIDGPTDITWAFTKKCKTSVDSMAKTDKKKIVTMVASFALVVIIVLGFFVFFQRNKIQELLIRLKHNTNAAKYKKVKTDDDVEEDVEMSSIEK